MSDQNLKEGDFKVLNILLIKSAFNRVPDVNFTQKYEKKQNLNVEVSCNVTNNQAIVKLILKCEILDNQRPEILIEIEMVGVFEQIKESKISLEEFGKTNGAAIVFPFIREHISHLTLKAGLGQILIPLLNFQIQKKEEK